MLPKSLLDAMKNCRRIMEEEPRIYDKDKKDKDNA